MSHTANMPRLIKLANRNRNGGLRVILTTAMIVGSTLAGFTGFLALATGIV